MKTHHDVVKFNQQRYEEGVRNGTIVPTVYPAFTYALALLILFFLIPPSSRFHNKFTRYLTFGVTAAWHIWLITNCKAYGPSVSFGIGLISAWGVLWAAVLLIFHDAKADWKRVKREEIWFAKDLRDGNIKQPLDEKKTNGNAVRERKAKPSSKPSDDERIQSSMKQPQRIIEERRVTYCWQAYPSQPFRERLEWACDIIANMRGVGWTWKISGLPSRPGLVQASLNADIADDAKVEDIRVSRNGVSRCDTYWSLMIHNAWLIVKGYIAADIIKTIMIHDPYFWGLVDRSAPTWLPRIIQTSFLLTRSYRLMISMSVVWIGLRTIYCFGPVFFVGVLGPDVLGFNGEPWMYPDHFGSYWNVYERGLAGWWGGWWHQVFRFGFQSGGHWLADDVLRLQPESMTSKMVQLFTAFMLSGFIHASGSRTMVGVTMPLRNSFLFFLLQPLGIIIEMVLKNLLNSTKISQKMPWQVTWTGNFIFVHAWFLATGPLLTDDFARGGIWLFEPIMLSPLRGLGFGVEGDGFFCWGGRHFAWHPDSRWWLKGIAL